MRLTSTFASITRRAPGGALITAIAIVTAAVSPCVSTLSAQQSSGVHTPRVHAIAQQRVQTDAAVSAQDHWVDSVLTTLSLRDKVAQLVWPWMLGDYVATDDPAWLRSLTLVRDQHVGGIIMSVGSPTEIAEKINALQRAAPLPLLVSADLETGAAFRARGGYFLPNGIDLGGSTQFPYQMGVGATRDTTLAYAMGRVTATSGMRKRRV